MADKEGGRTRVGDGEGPWAAADRYRVSPFNYSPEVQGLYHFPEKVVILDATMRRIGTTPGIKNFPTSARLELARLLDGVGVPEIGVNPGWFTESVWGDADLEGARAICRAGLKLKVVASMENRGWMTGDYSYLDKTIDAGVDAIELGISWRSQRRQGLAQSPVLQEAAGKTSDDIDLAVARAIEYVRGKGLEVGVLPGATIRDPVDLEQILRRLNRYVDCGAQRVRSGDTSGGLNPDSTRFVVRRLRQGLRADVRLTWIVHNQFGLGTGVAIAAAEAGAQPETHVNGIAHEGGASLEELVLALELWYGVKTGIKLEGLAELCSAVERITGIKNHPLKPVVGAAMWAPTHAWQAKEVMAGNDAMGIRLSPYNPEVVGTHINRVWSAAMLAPLSVAAKLEQLELPHGADDVAAAIAALHARIDALDGYPYWLTDAEVEQVCRQRRP